MKDTRKYYKLLDVIRAVSCIGVLLYHLGYLKGGFLSVCAFFVLSGYLSYLSLSRKEKVSFKEYYKNRFFHIYLPLLTVVFLTICIAAFFPDLHWFQLKPETTSVLFGYNNYWQLSVNADYFARHISSPFMHFWYIGILLQFELVFPFLFMLLKKSKEKIGKLFPIILLSLFTLASMGYFLYSTHDVMTSYYDTLARVFSLFIGVLLGYIHKEYKPLILPKYVQFFFYFYLIVFIILQLIIDSNSFLYALMMILVSLITCRLISYGTVEDSKELSFWDREVKYLSSISYEVYLLQYPVIFFFQYLIVPMEWKLPIMILIIYGLAYFIHFCLDFKNQKNYYFRLVCTIFLSILCTFGLVQYIIAKDYTSEMNELKSQLSSNQKLIASKQKDYEKRLQEENDEWNLVLQDLENGENQLASYVSNLPIVAVGDSVMLGATPTLYQQFPNAYFDAAVSRTDYEANRILQSFKNQGLLSDNVVIHLGTNGQCGLSCQREIMATCEGRHVFIVTVSNDYEVHVNQSFYELAQMYPNITIIDWASAASGHGEYFVADGVHLTGSGMDAYTQTIYSGIYAFYHQQYEQKKQAILIEHEEKMNTKVNFYGNSLLLNVYPDLQKDFPNSMFLVKAEYSIDELMKDLGNEIENKTISKKILIAMDQKQGISKHDYERIIQLASNQEIYFLFAYHAPYDFKEDYVHVLDFFHLVNDDDFIVDGIHLSNEGNKKLIQFIQTQMKKKD